MKRKKIWDNAKNALVIIVTTLLIWFVADQYVREVQDFPVTVQVVSNSPDRYAAIDNQAHQITLNVEMAGRRGQLNAFEKLIKSKTVFQAKIDDRPSGTKPQSISAIDDILRKIKEISEARVSIKDVRPRTVKVIIDDYEVVSDVAVEPDFGDLQVNATCSPETVSVYLPRSAKERFLSEPVIRPDAADAVREATKGHTQTSFREVPLILNLAADATLGIRIIPSTVTLTGVVQDRRDKQIKGPVQITFSIPDEVEKHFAAVANPDTQFRRSIEVAGPKEILDQLDPRDIRAFVDVMAADAETPNKEITRRVNYVLPASAAGCSLDQDSPQHVIVFRLVPRPAIEPSGT